MDPDAVLAPPYDVVDEAEAAALHARSPYNAARVESPRGGAERFAEAAAALRRWEAEGVLRREAAPALYAYEQRAPVGGEVRTRRGCLARLRLSPFADGAVRPHERTMAAPKAERLALLRAAGADVSPIFVIAGDPSGEAAALLAGAARRRPAFAATDARGGEHRLWALGGAAEIARLAAAFAPGRATIADGHHRYETALDHLAEGGADAAEGRRWVLACLVPEGDPGLAVLPTHRLVPADPPPDFGARLQALYDIEPLEASGGPADGAAAAARLWDRVRASAAAPGTFGLIGPQGTGPRLLRPRSREAIGAALPDGWSAASRALDVLILTETILGPLLGVGAAELAGGRVEFSEDAERAGAWALAAPGRLAFLVNPPRVDQVAAVADAGEVLPQKSTFFYPKLATGMVFNPLD